MRPFDLYQFDENLLKKWRGILDNAVLLLGGQAALIMKANLKGEPFSVFLKNQGGTVSLLKSKSNKEAIDQFCGEVLSQRKTVASQVHAKREIAFDDFKSISFALLGLPLLYPDGKSFGVLCLLDCDGKRVSTYAKLLEQFRVSIENDLKMLNFAKSLLDSRNNYRKLLHVVCHDLLDPVASASFAIKIAQEDENLSKNGSLSRANQMLSEAEKIAHTIKVMEKNSYINERLPNTRNSIKDCIDRATLILQPRFEEKRINLQTQIESGEFWGNATSFTHSIICNILSNAVKFSHPDSTVSITGKRIYPNYTVKIEDMGIGMTDEQIAMLFVPDNYHSTKGTLEEEGTGFGSYLIHSFLKQMNGNIKVESRSISNHPEEHGTEITITLPLYRDDRLSVA